MPWEGTGRERESSWGVWLGERAKAGADSCLGTKKKERERALQAQEATWWATGKTMGQQQPALMN